MQILQAGFTPTGYVFSPSAWETISSLKNSVGEYITGQPGAPRTGPVRELWNLPVTISSMAENVVDFLCGDFARGSQLFIRQNITVQIATQNEDDFIKYMVTVRAEERLAHAVYFGAAYVKKSFGVTMASASKKG